MKMGTIAATIAGSISNGGGVVVVNADGSVSVTPASGTGLTLPTTAPATATYGLVSLGPAALFDGQSAGHFVGGANGTYLAINAPSGYTGDLINVAVGGGSRFRLFASGLLAPASLTTSTITDITSGNSSRITLGGTGTLTVSQPSAHPAAAILTAQGSALQTGDLIQGVDSGQNIQFAIANAGTGAAPKWALRVRAVANAESMAQLHTAGAATGRAIQFVDDAGVSLGWLNLTL